jgi:VWFA-related protein
MIGFLLSAGLLTLQAGAQAEVRQVAVSVTDDKGRPVAGLVPEEVAVIENGVARELSRIEPDRRPLSVIVLVDTSQAAAPSFRLNVVDAVIDFLRRLPEDSRYALWTTGDRPAKLVDFTSDVTEAARALKRVAPQGGNTLLDALVEATRELRKQEAARSAVVVVTTLGIEFSSRDKQTVVEEAQKNASAFHAVQYSEAEAPFETRSSYEYVLAGLTQRTGGLYETPLSAMGVPSSLRKIVEDLRGQYRLSYLTLPEIKARKLEVKVARPSVKVRVGAAIAQKP